jgi:glutaredoxin
MKTIFWVIILLILAGVLALGLKKTTEAFEPNIEIVVSRYNEDLEWLKSKKFRYPTTIYNKGTNDNFYKPKGCKVVKLPNVGVCVHTYLHHIIENYDNLSEITMFLPGSCMDSHKQNKTLTTLSKTMATKNTVFIVNKHENNILDDISISNFQLDDWKSTNVQNQELNTESSLKKCKIRPFGKWYNQNFPNITVNSINYHGIFSISKAHIQNRSKDSYKELIKFVQTHKNEECAHYFERAFLAVFHPIPDEFLYNLST